MLQWLGDWLKQLIVMVMIAGFIDLLLPTQSMQRYVKVVIGLFLLMMMLSPIFRLFEHKWSPDLILAAAERNSLDSGNKAFRSLDDIMRDANRMQATSRDQAKQLMETQLAGVIRQGVELEFKRTVSQVIVRSNFDHAGVPVVQMVEVTLAPEKQVASLKEVSEQEAKSPAPLMQVVKPVIVEVKPIQPDSPTREVQATEKPLNQQMVQDVKRYVSRTWQLSLDLIKITER